MEMIKVQYARYAVDDTPYCLWGENLSKHNLDFLKSIDPRYFEHMAHIHGDLLTGEDRQYAAIALRTSYSHGLETLFSFLCAAVQAPECVVGWILKYQNRELFSAVRKIHNRQPIKSKLPVNRVSWDSIAAEIFKFINNDAEQYTRLHNSFARLWRRFAGDFLNERLDQEYNSIKHGLRIRMGGFNFSLGAQESLGVPAPPERMVSLVRSEFGSSFFTTEKMHDSNNLLLKDVSLNWHPENYMHGLILISVSINNIIAYLKATNGETPDNCEYTYPTEEGAFDEPWKRRFSVETFAWGSRIDPQYINPLSKTEILSVYDNQGQSTTQEASKE